MNEQYPERTAGRELPPTISGGQGAGAAEGDLVGRVLGGRYRILRKLGEGAMGAVYLGEHMKIGRQDAIKVLRDALATDPDTIARFVRGTRNVSMIRHPNICTIYDYSDTGDGVQFVAMEFVPGETLRDFLQREGRLPVEVAVHIARQAAEALDAAHDVGIVHRDLKPANIMVVRGRSGALEVKVVDFDIAKGSADGEGEEVTRMGFVVGTPEYMSPEQLIGDRLDGRSDIYSLALVLYRMLTGTLPFAAQDTQDLMVKRLTEDPMTLGAGFPGGSFPPALEAAIRRALQRKPAERQATAAEFGREIGAAVEIAPTVAPTAAHPRQDNVGGEAEARPSRWRLPMLAKVGGAAAVLVLLAVAGVLAFMVDPGQGDPTPVNNRLDQSQGPIAEFNDSEVAPADSLAEGGLAEEETVQPPPRTDPVSVAAADEEPVEDPAGPAPPPTSDELIRFLASYGANPNLRELTVGRDMALEAWNHPAASPLTRATAAYLASSSLAAMGDTAQALTWIDRAIELRPDYSAYQTLRGALQPPPAYGY